MDTLSYRTVSAKNKSAEDREWILIDAEGQILGRVASVIAMILRGKHKAEFTPHSDTGDNVIVINAEKIKMTGNKWTDREYVRHSGYPGGQRTRTPEEQLKRKPEVIIEHAVKGMLPKNRLGRAIFKNMFVYAGSEHPHSAQKPKTIDLNTIK